MCYVPARDWLKIARSVGKGELLALFVLPEKAIAANKDRRRAATRIPERLGLFIQYQIIEISL